MAIKAGTAKKAVSKPRAKKAAPPADAIVAFKGFSKDLECLGHKFEIGKSYTHKGAVLACSSGYHACENPLDVWSYYGIGEGNRFCRVHLSGTTDRHEGDTKVAAETIFVETEVTLGEMIKEGIRLTFAAAKEGQTEDTGDYSKLAASGDYSKLAASGYSSKLAASGHYSKLAASGDSSQLAASGYFSKLAASGNSSQLAASGDYSKLAASGDYSKLAASGYSSKLAASGHYSKLAASGDSSQLAASGDYSQLAASGDYSKLEVIGAKSAAASVGPSSTVKAVAGTPIAICEYDRTGKPIGFATGIAGKDDVPADTWLIAKNGKLVAA